MAGMAGRRSGRNGCFGAAAAGVLHGARTIPTVAGRSMRALSRLADVAGFWTLDRTTITGRSAVILRQHNTVSSYDCTVRERLLADLCRDRLRPTLFPEIRQEKKGSRQTLFAGVEHRPNAPYESV